MTSTHDYIADSRNKNIKIYINGEYFIRSEAKISVFDSGFLLGDGVWEGIRLHEKKLIHIEDHINRLYEGAKVIDIKIHLSKKELVNAIWSTLKKNKMQSNVHIRLIISRGMKSTPYQHPNVTISKPTIVIIPEFKKTNIEKINKGIRIVSVTTLRDSNVQDPKINSLSKMNCISACIEADKKGVDEGLMLDSNGYVSTCNSTNFFIVKNNEVWTSSGHHCLNGVTRGAIINICRKNNIPIFEKDFLLEEVYDADEAFVTGTFAGVIPVIEIDGKQFSNNTIGKYTAMIQNLYLKDINNYAK